MCSLKCIYSRSLCMKNIPSVISSIPKIFLHVTIVVLDVSSSLLLWWFFLYFIWRSLLLLLARVSLNCGNLQRWTSVLQLHVTFPCTNTLNVRSNLLQSFQINVVGSPSNLINFFQINVNLILSDSFLPELLMTNNLHIQWWL